MLPTLFSIGNFSISSFGVFLSLSFLYGIFLIWRFARGWELNEEKVLDLTLITFVVGLIGARLYFAMVTPAIGFDFLKIILIIKYPGFSFWGGILGGFLSIILFSKRLKMDFWQSLDIASVGLLGGLILANFGCFLAGCNAGIQSNLFFALPVAGLIGRRIPVSLFEALLLILFLKKVWFESTHFHPRGKILSLSLIFIGVSKLVTQPLKQTGESLLFSLILTILGLIVFYKVTKRHIFKDFKNILFFPGKVTLDSGFRKTLMVSVKKSWYNQRVTLSLRIKNFFNKVRRLNVYVSHKNSKYYKKSAT